MGRLIKRKLAFVVAQKRQGCDPLEEKQEPITYLGVAGVPVAAMTCAREGDSILSRLIDEQGTYDCVKSYIKCP
jgi:hypothetical protein